MPKVGDILGEKYRLDALIGKGGMGEVYSGTQIEFGKRVAVKCLYRDAAKEEKVVERFTREARAAAAIGHHGIIDIYDVGEDDGAPYLVMEYLEGMDLSGTLNQRGRLEQPYAAYVLCQVLSALEAAHCAGIVHRDLKPDNVFLVETRQALPDVKLLDFGISKISDAGQKVHRLTETGIMMGTPYYMAPEQARAERDIDHRVDLYATGVVLYECVTGHLPFSAPALHALVYEIIHEPVKPPRSINPEITSELEEVILKAMARAREDRYQSANEMLLALIPLMDEEHVGLISLPLGVTHESLRPPSFDEELDALAQTVNASAPTFLSIEQPVVDDSFDKTLQDEELDETIEDERPGLMTESEMDDEAENPETRVGDDQLGATNESPAVRRSGHRLGWAVAGLLGVMVVVGSLYFAMSRDVAGDDHAGEGGNVAQQPRDDRSSTVGASGPHDGTPNDDVVAVTLREVPEGAAVFFEGARVEGTTLRRPRSAIHREVRVELAGFEPWRRMIEFNEDRDLEVQLIALDEPDSGQEPDAGPPRPPDRLQKRIKPPSRGDEDRPVLLEWGQTGTPRRGDGSESP